MKEGRSGNRKKGCRRPVLQQKGLQETGRQYSGAARHDGCMNRRDIGATTTRSRMNDRLQNERTGLSACHALDRHRPQRWSAASVIALLALTTLSAPNAWGRAYVTETVEGYTIRCSTIRSTELPDEVLNRYAVVADDAIGVLSCVVQEQEADGTYRNARADVTATVTNLVGMVQGSPVREVLEGDVVTYIATYRIPNDNPLTFDLVIQPEGAPVPLSIEFEDVRADE
jgi:hypothetical protein